MSVETGKRTEAGLSWGPPLGLRSERAWGRGAAAQGHGSARPGRVLAEGRTVPSRAARGRHRGDPRRAGPDGRAVLAPRAAASDVGELRRRAAAADRRRSCSACMTATRRCCARRRSTRRRSCSSSRRCARSSRCWRADSSSPARWTAGRHCSMAGARRAAAARSCGPRAAIALRLGPVERCLFIGDERSARSRRREAERSQRRQGEDRRAPRHGPGRAVVDGRLLGAAADGDPRPSAGRSTCTARSSRPDGARTRSG